MVEAIQTEVFRELTRVLNQLAPDKLVIAYSGGLDSSVLLQLVADWLRRTDAVRPISVQAVYVNHGMAEAADAWQQHCHLEAERLGIPFAGIRIDQEPMPGCSPEEELRLKRYVALRSFMQPGQVLLTAHHRDDQAETVLLQLLRGAGPDGLAAMSPLRKSGDISIARPMLGLSRKDISAFAQTRQLRWVDDPSNTSLRYDRNYLRHRVIPALAERWPGWTASVLCASGHQAETASLLDDIADTLVQTCVSPDGALDLAAAASLDDSRKKLLLRRWIRLQNLPSPSRRQLRHLLNTYLSEDDKASGGMVCWKNTQVRCYRRRLYAMAPLADLNTAVQKTWLQGTDLELPEISRKLSWEALRTQMPALAETPALMVRFRQGGEKYFHVEKNYHQSLKKVFQQLGVPPWERSRIPLVYRDDELRLIWGYQLAP